MLLFSFTDSCKSDHDRRIDRSSVPNLEPPSRQVFVLRETLFPSSFRDALDKQASATNRKRFVRLMAVEKNILESV